MTLRARAGIAYREAYRRLPVPRSVAALPRLPAEPLSRAFGLDRGRPVDRVYLERFLERHAGDVRGRVLEVAEPTYTRRFGGARVERADVLDVLDSPAATVRGDLGTGEGVPHGAFDCFVCTQVLSSTPDPAAALRVAHDALAPGGVLLASVPGVSPWRGGDEVDDLWRFTPELVRRLAAPVFGAGVEVHGFGTVRTAAAFVYGMAEEDCDPAWFAEPDDDGYAVVACLRARKPGP